MIKPRLTKEEIRKIIYLRKIGKTLSEIREVVPKSKGTIYGYIKNVYPYKKYFHSLSQKMKGTKNKANNDWLVSQKIIKEKLGKISKRDMILIAGILYWGEGTKKQDLNIINSDHYLLKVFIKGILALGVEKTRIRISLRLFFGMDEKLSIKFWLKELNLDRKQLISIEWVEGKKPGKLLHGMCRLRVIKPKLYFKQLISIIDFIKMLS